MPSPPAFRRLTVQAFRGFRDKVEIDLSADAVILAGPNGTGKTSVFDALQWLLLGHLERLEPLRRRQNDEHIVNHYALPGPAVVECEMWMNDRLATIRRSGKYNTSLLEIVVDQETYRGDDATSWLEEALSPGPDVTLDTAMLTSGLLQQDVMRKVLEAKPRETYDHLNDLLGLSVIAEFEQAATSELESLAKATKDARRSEQEAAEAADVIRSQIEQIESKAAARPSSERVIQSLEEILADIAPWVVRPSAVATDGEALTLASTEIASFVRELDQISAALNDIRFRGQRLVAPSAKDLERAKAVLQEAADASVARAAELALSEKVERDATNQSERLTELAALAIPLLSEICPVCAQPIDARDVTQRLEALADDVELLVGLQDARQQAQEAADLAEVRKADADQTLSQLLEQDAATARLREDRNQIALRLKRLTEGEGIHTLLGEAAESLLKEPAQIAGVVSQLRQLDSAYQRLYTILSRSDPSLLAQRRAELADWTQQHAVRKRRVEQASQRETRAKTLVTATTNARVNVITGRFRALEPLVEDIYTRLDPHPSFKSLIFEHEIYRSKGTTAARVRDPIEGVVADPLLVLSTAQANIAALAFFLSLGWAAGDRALPFLLLDDPLQSMDDVNVLGFADLCRFIRQRRQLIISTHEKRFANLLERKLAPRSEDERTLVLDFEGWDRPGPSIRTRTVTPQVAEGRPRLLRVG